MPKKKSLVWLSCSEIELSVHLKDWLKSNSLKNALIFLEGEMGAGKSTFARLVLRHVAPAQRSMGSPTFPLVQEYTASDDSRVYHIDLYRLKNEHELEDSGIESQIEEPGSTAMIEWASMFESSFAHWFDEGRRPLKKVYLVRITDSSNDLRDYEIVEIN
jgi:tRNA threonylcarbamoyl adenosine modification protein YjeE